MRSALFEMWNSASSKRGQCLAGETILLRSEDDADRLLGRRRGRGREPLFHPIGGAVDRQRHDVAAPQCPPFEAAERRTHIGRGAAEHPRNGDRALDSEIGADRFAAEVDPEHVAAREDRALPGGDDPHAVADREAGAGAGDRDPRRFRHDLEGRSAEQDFERRRTRRIADERVAEAQGGGVERARDRDPQRLIPDPAEILHRRVQAGIQHFETSIHAAAGSLSIA